MNICFAADRALGKLVKWLRILGYDTIYEKDVSSQRFCKHLEKNRIILTRTEKIRKAVTDHKLVFVKSNYLEAQLRQVIQEIGIKRKEIRPFSRCIHCNLSLVDINKNDVFNQVPSYIWEIHEEFHICRQCERIYWPGSHAQRSMEKIEQLFR
jgi:uncharacterized protein with PIN domain